MPKDLVSGEQKSESALSNNIKAKPAPERKTNRLSDALIVVSVMLLVVCLFWKTAFLGVPISKIARLTVWDSAFAGIRQGTSAIMDPSLVQLTIPYSLFSAKLWHSGQIPLWNQFSGCGMPLLADPQAKVFSPLLAVLSLRPDLAIYNRVLIIELCIAAAGGFLLSRSLGLGRIASVLAALAYTFCPFLDFYLEWNGSAFIFYPLVFWLFTRAAKSMRASDAAIAGIGVAAMVLSGHPEVTFLGAVFATFLFSMLYLFDAFQTQLAWSQRVATGGKQLAIAASVCFCLCAPLLIPFGQYLANADCYKFVSTTIDKISWQALFLNLLQPAMGNGSLYLGILPILCLPFCLAVKEGNERRALLAVVLTFAASEAFTARIWPFSLLFSLPALSTIIPNYGQPAALLMLTVAAAFGFEQLSRLDLRTPKRLVIMVACTAAVILIPLVVRLANVHLGALQFDSALTDIRLSEREWRELAAMTLGVAVLLLLKDRWNPKVKRVLLVTCLAASFLSEFREAKGALADQAKFNYPNIACADALSNIPGRYIATGEHLLKPNTNVVYGLRDLRCHNPLFPRRYLNLMRACGARLDGFNETFQPPLKSVLSLPSVCRIASLGPVWSEHTVDTLPTRPIACAWPGIRLTAYSAGYDRENRQVIGKLQWRLSDPLSHRAYSLALVDKGGTPLWFSDLEPLPTKPTGGTSTFTKEFGVAVPSSVKDSDQLTISIRVFDTHNAKFVKPTTHEHTAGEQSYELIRLDHGLAADSAVSKINDPQFKLSSELPSHIRIYSNTTSCPQAYLVTSVRTVSSEEDALGAISSASFDPRHAAVVEAAEWQPLSSAKALAEPDSHAVIRRKSATEIEVECNAPSPSLLVQTDAFYPGWVATVDDHPAPIYRTNYFFRGVPLPPGPHKVEFFYHPGTFLVGSILAVLCITVLLTWACLATAAKMKGKREDPESQS